MRTSIGEWEVVPTALGGSGRRREGGVGSGAQRGPGIPESLYSEARTRPGALQPIQPVRALPPAAVAGTGTPSVGSQAPEEPAGA